MAIHELKERLHTLIDTTNNEMLLEDLLHEAEHKIAAINGYEAEGLSKEDFDELVQLVHEPSDKDTLAYSELKLSLNRWFTK